MKYVFSTKHTEFFDEASSANQLSVISETLLGRSGYGDTTPYRKVEANLKTDNRLSKDKWETTLNANGRYLEQSEIPADPLRRGFDVANWTLTGAYKGEKGKAKLSLGDILFNESPYTIYGLSRKGSLFEGEYDGYYAKAFMLRSEQSFGLDGGIGTSGATGDRIFGTVLGAKFFEQKMEVRATYLDGGDASTFSAATPVTSPESTYGISTLPGQKRGQVLDFLVSTNFFDNRLKMEGEAAFSDYSPDTGSGARFRRDAAYRFKAEGVQGIYSYGALYEYIGRNFGTVGNQSAERDKQRAVVTNGLSFEKQSVNLTLSRLNDNVRKDSLFGQNIGYNGNLVYSYTGIQNMPITFGYVKDLQRSHGDPNVRINKDGDIITGSISYSEGPWLLGFAPAFSHVNDKASTDADIQMMSYSFTPAYSGETFSISSNLTFSRSFTSVPHVSKDTYTVGLNVRKDLLDKRLVFDSANTFTREHGDHNSAKLESLYLTGTVSYNLKQYLGNAVEPTVGLRASYLRIKDRINSINDKEESRFFLVLTLAAPFFF
ncbi:MAG TPA: hypothetical protein VHO84_06255 [Syntrophorhabdaceae bacterium]|nr:hypothetical protein [Syntrophorhabdaceae bacterium]